MTLVTWGPNRIWLELGLPRGGSAHSLRTENAQTLYAENFKEPSHLNAIVGEGGLWTAPFISSTNSE